MNEMSKNAVQEQGQELTEEQSLELLKALEGQEVINSFHIQMDDKELEDIMSSKEYQQGVKIASKLIGMYTALTNFGIDEATASIMVSNERTQQLNILNEKLHNENKLKSEILKDLEMEDDMILPVRK